jgi:hypothetical protein
LIRTKSGLSNPEETYLDIEVLRKLRRRQVGKQANSSDEFQHMTNWARIFEDIYMKIKWLKTYSCINHVAAFKIIKKFSKNYFKLKDNTLDKQLKQYVTDL